VDQAKAEFGKRALNKAKTRLNLLNAAYRLTDTMNFRELKVRDLAGESGITEMTFFNYFQKKEDILRYMMGIWALDLTALHIGSPLSGEAAIRRIFEHTARLVRKHPRLMVNFIASLVTSEVESEAGDIDAADRYLLYPRLPELYAARIPSGNEMLLHHLAEIDPTQDHTQSLLHLASCFYGDVLVAHTAGLDIATLYANSLDLILEKVAHESLVI